MLVMIVVVAGAIEIRFAIWIIFVVVVEYNLYISRVISGKQTGEMQFLSHIIWIFNEKEH